MSTFRYRVSSFVAVLSALLLSSSFAFAAIVIEDRPAPFLMYNFFQPADVFCPDEGLHASLVNDLYRISLGRCANPAELSKSAQQRPADILRGLLASGEYVNLNTAKIFRNILKRDARASDALAAQWAASGRNYRVFMTNIYKSVEYVDLHKGFFPARQAEELVKAYFQDILGRLPTSSELTAWKPLMVAQEGRAAKVRTILVSLEHFKALHLRVVSKAIFSPNIRTMLALYDGSVRDPNYFLTLNFLIDPNERTLIDPNERTLIDPNEVIDPNAGTEIDPDFNIYLLNPPSDFGENSFIPYINGKLKNLRTPKEYKELAGAGVSYDDIVVAIVEDSKAFDFTIDLSLNFTPVVH